MCCAPCCTVLNVGTVSTLVPAGEIEECHTMHGPLFFLFTAFFSSKCLFLLIVTVPDLNVQRKRSKLGVALAVRCNKS